MDDIETRKANLIEFLRKESVAYGRAAQWNEFFVQVLFYGSLLFGALAVVSGLIKSVNISTEVISLFAGLGTGATALARTANYRAHADWNYAVRDIAKGLMTKLEFEVAHPQDSISAISEEWRKRREQLGNEMYAINRSRQHPAAATDNPPPPPH